MVDLFATADPINSLICSGKGCRADARWGLLWNNPKIHTPERRKVWLACDDHLSHLNEFLSLRGFLKDVVPVETLEHEAAEE
ncbi:hypothetical protein [Timonella sp. A28]|uniref:hypothetical protein n=1 Tax=Timonella sp. A28 TaxID=3442640 RepID=UPI003EB769C6